MWPYRPIAISRLSYLVTRPLPATLLVAAFLGRNATATATTAALLQKFSRKPPLTRFASTAPPQAGKPSPKAKGSSSSSAKEPARLAKPNRYRPPSHFDNPTTPRKNAHTPLPRPEHKSERAHYPGSMPEPGTVAHFFLHNKIFHAIFTLSTLIALACYVGVRDFLEASPYSHLAFWDWKHPIASIKSFVEAYRADDKSHSMRIMEKRRRRLEDMEKRAHYALVVEGKTGGEGWGISVRPHPYDEEWGTVRIRGKRVVDLIAEAKEKKEKEERRARGEIVEDDEEQSDTQAAAPEAPAPVEINAEKTGTKSPFLWWGSQKKE